MADEDGVSWGTGLNKLELRVQGFPTRHNLPDVSFDTKHPWISPARATYQHSRLCHLPGFNNSKERHFGLETNYHRDLVTFYNAYLIQSTMTQDDVWT